MDNDLIHTLKCLPRCMGSGEQAMIVDDLDLICTPPHATKKKAPESFVFSFKAMGGGQYKLRRYQGSPTDTLLMVSSSNLNNKVIHTHGCFSPSEQHFLTQRGHEKDGDQEQHSAHCVHRGYSTMALVQCDGIQTDMTLLPTGDSDIKMIARGLLSLSNITLWSL